MNRTKNILATLALGAVLLPLSERPAQACGGCVAPENAFTAVDAHRMVIAVGAEQTILWDQFIYSGAPEEFAWVLPVPSQDAVVEVADEDFVTVFDRETTPIVSPAADPCGASLQAGGAGCGGSDGGQFGPPPTDGVEVFSQGVAGPYETVVLGADDPQNLYNWLALNGYAFPSDGVPILDHYIAQESAFVVLRLRPEADVSAMQPVRIRFKGFMGQFPLRMVALGAQASLEMSLWIVAEQRYAALNYDSTVIDPRDLVWDWSTETSNYEEVFAQTIENGGGRVWITEFAGRLDDSALARALQEEAPADYAALGDIHYPYVTRLRSDMLVEYLNEDLEIGPSEDAGARPRELLAYGSVNGECEAASGMSIASRSGVQMAFLLLLSIVALGLGGRTRRRRLGRGLARR